MIEIKRDTDRRLSEFCQFEVYFKRGATNPLKHEATTHIIKRTDVEKLTRAYLELHYSPGVNPHNGGRTAVVYEIKVGTFLPSGPFWWTTPGLDKNDDPNGVTLYTVEPSKVIWRHPDYQKLLDKEDREMLEQEANL